MNLWIPKRKQEGNGPIDQRVVGQLTVTYRPPREKEDK